jgi:phospholipase C
MYGNAPDRAVSDPGHEFEDVSQQIAGSPPMSGFQSLPDWNITRQGLAVGDLPILRTLAKQYCLFDNWYSSLPGPTWPNRFFVHAGSSGGLDNSPSDATTIETETIDSLSFQFPNLTVYDHLAAAGHSWRVYHDDLFPQVLAIKGMIDPFRLNDDHFRWIRTSGAETFRNDLHSGRPACDGCRTNPATVIELHPIGRG